MSPQTTGLISSAEAPVLDVGGPSIAHLVTGTDADPHVLRGTIPAGVFAPLHAHPEPETFVVTAGSVQACVGSGADATWTDVEVGELFHVPGNTPHAWRNVSEDPVVTLITVPATLSSFFAEIGTPVPSAADTAWPPSPALLERLLEASARYGYWNATPEENAAIGLELGP